MATIRSRWLWAAPAVLVGALAVAAFAWRLWGATLLSPAVAAQIEAATGLRLVIEGPMQATLFPRPGLRAIGIRLAPPDGAAAAADTVRGDTLAVDFGWAVLLRGAAAMERVQLQRLRFLAMPVHPPLDLDVKLGRSGLDIAVAGAGMSVRAAAHQEAETLALERIEARAGDIVSTGSGRLSLRDPLRLVLNTTLSTPSGTNLGAAAMAVSYSEDGLVVERATWRRVDGVEATMFGHAAADRGTLRFEGGVDASTADGGDAAARFDGRFGADGLTIAVDDIDAHAGASHLTGRGSFVSGTRARVSAELRLDRLDIGGGSDTLPSVLFAMMTPFTAEADAALRLRVDEVADRTRSVADGIVLDLVRHGATFELRELAARAVSGAPLRAHGQFVLGPGPVVTLEPFAATYGRIDVTGRAEFDLSGPRPKLAGDLTSGPLDLDALVAAPPAPPPEPMTRRAAAAARQASSTATWSRTPLNLSPAFPVDADIVAAAPYVLWRHRRLDDVHARVQMGDRRLAVRDLTGAVYGGRLEANVDVDGQGVPHLAGQARLTGADLQALLTDLAGIANLSARGDVVAELSADGTNPADLVAALAGNVALEARNGVLSGVDLAAVSEKLKGLRRPADVIELARLAAGGGRTPFASLSGHVRIDRGIARTDDLQLAAATAAARLRGSVNLPAWAVDLTDEFQLTDPPGLAPLILKIEGPISAPRRVFDISRLQSSLLRRSSPAR